MSFSMLSATFPLLFIWLNFKRPIIDPDGMITYDWQRGVYLGDGGAEINREEAIRTLEGMGNTIYRKEHAEEVDPPEKNKWDNASPWRVGWE